MRFSNRGGLHKAVTAIFAAAILCLLGIWVYQTGELTAVSRYKAQLNTTEYASHAQKRIEHDCLQREAAAVAKCVQEIVQATNEHRRSENDLVAQGEMAHWAFWMIVISAASVGITSIGVIYVALTLQETRRTTRAAIIGAKAASRATAFAREQLISSNRAWLAIESVNLVHPTRFLEEGAIFAVKLHIKNLGVGPATRARVEFESFFFESDGRSFTAAEDEFERRLRTDSAPRGYLLSKGDEMKLTLRWPEPKEKIERAITTRPSGSRKLGFIVFIGVGYRVAYDSKVHCTYGAYSMLNVPIGTSIAEGIEVDLPAMAFHEAKAD